MSQVELSIDYEGASRALSKQKSTGAKLTAILILSTLELLQAEDREQNPGIVPSTQVANFQPDLNSALVYILGGEGVDRQILLDDNRSTDP